MVGEAASDRKRTFYAKADALSPPSRWPVELQALHGTLPDSLIDWAAARARDLRVGGDEVLICSGLLTGPQASARLAAHLDLALQPPDVPLPVPPDLAPTVLRLQTFQTPPEDDLPGYVIAARGLYARRLASALREDPTLKRRARVIATEHLHGTLARQCADGIGRAAAFDLRTHRPDVSAGTIRFTRRMLLPATMAGAAVATAGLSAPLETLLIVQSLLSTIFLASATLRIATCLARPEEPPPLGMPDAALPLYSIIVPLYREERVLPRLVRALQAIDYPPEKLDIKIVVEPDDAPVHAALARMALPPWFEIIVAPDVGPRTKPKALNCALPFTRGSFVVVFDAEDVPDPDQLKRALAAFRQGGRNVACVQARLSVENADETWISRLFAAEYAGQFDVLLPGLAQLRMPILLGGTSNHFRRSMLELIGAWDPYNVTEDADLGVRLARAGWTTAVIGSSTAEEAPITRAAWMRQRTRWLKGWAQTLLVHGRQPLRLVRELGWGNLVPLLLLTAGPFASALLHPLCVAWLIADVVRGVFLTTPGTTLGVVATALSLTNLAIGYGAAAWSCGLGLKRRGQFALAPILILLPFYWLLLSVAAWRAVAQLIVRPYWWDKTEHGLGRLRPQAPLPAGAPARAPAGILTDSA